MKRRDKMPYGVDKDIGGDSPENDKWMENCVKKVMATGKEKSNAVAICKSTLKKTKGNQSKAEFILNETWLNEVWLAMKNKNTE
jgi:ribosomal protein S7